MLCKILAFFILPCLVISFKMDMKPAFEGTVPKFEISEERTLDGAPSVVVKFPDGYTDTLLLTRHYANEEDRLARNDDCNFIGHLTNEPETCVAMTGCLGSDHVDFTIMSSHASGSTMFHWSKEGDVRLIEHHLSKTDNLTRTIDDDEIIIPEIQQATQHYCDKNNCDDLPATQLLKIKVVYDNTFKSGVTNKEKYINALWTHLQANYCHYTLTSKVKVEKFGSPSHVEKYMTNTEESTLNHFATGTDTEISDGAHLVAYLGFQSKGGSSGLASVGTVCRSFGNSGKSSINLIGTGYGAHAIAGGLLAHEIGHNLGMNHDFEVIHGGTDCKTCTELKNSQTSTNACNNQGVMSYGEPSQRGQWSECSVKDFKGIYNLRKNGWCLAATQDNFCGTQTLCNKATFKDGVCDPQNNNRACGYDGGDCCNRNTGWDTRCKAIGNPLECSCNLECQDKAITGGCKQEWCQADSTCTIQTTGNPPCRDWCPRTCNTCPEEILAIGLENGGKDCWTGCKSKQGKCDYCGFNGYCCRKGWTAGNGCDGSFGGENGHRCVLKPSSSTNGPFPCGDVNAESGKIQSFNYPNDYPNNKDCIWKITVPSGSIVTLEFETPFDIENHGSCAWDYLEIRDGGAATSPLLGKKLCGTTVPNTIKSTGNTMFVKFHSDGSVTKKGFSASFEAKKANECKDSQPTIWKNNYLATYGNICDNYIGPWKYCDKTWGKYCDHKKCGEFCKKTCNKC